MANQYPRYTAADAAYLRAHYTTASQADIQARLPGRVWTNIGNKACRLGCSGRGHVMPVKQISSWHETNLAILRTHYSTQGAAYVAELTGLTLHAVRAAASRNGIRYVAQGPRPRAPRPYRPRNASKVAAKPRLAKDPAAPVYHERLGKSANMAQGLAGKPMNDKSRQIMLPVRRNASTPNVNAAMSRKRRAEPQVTITAQEISRLSYNDPARMAYTMGGIAGWDRWKATQA